MQIRTDLNIAIRVGIVLVSSTFGSASPAAPPTSRVAVPTPTGAVTALAFSPNGRVLAVGRYRSVTLLDLATGRAVRTLPGLEGAVTSLTFAANGGVVAAGSGTPGKDGQIEFWETASGRRIRSLAAHTDLIYGISLRSDGKQLAAVSYDHLVSLWNLGAPAGRQPITPRYLRDHTDSVYGVAYSPSGRQLATAAADRTVKIWDTDTGKRLITLSDSTADQYAVAYRPDGRQLAAGGVDKILRIWNVDAAGATLARSAFAHDGAILRVVYAHNGKSLFTCGEDSTVKEWDADTLAERAVYPKQPDWPQSLALSPNDKLLAVGRYNGILALYDTATHRPVPLAPARIAAIAATTRALKHCVPQGHGAAGRTAKEFIPSPAFPSPAEGRTANGPGLFMNALTGTEGHTAAYAPGPTGELFVNKPGEFIPSPAAGRTAAEGSVSGADPELKQQPGNESIASAQPISVPSLVSGVLWNGKPNSPAPVHYYRFPARKGQPLVLDVMARRTGSPLDSEIEVLDLQGRPVERAVLRAVGQTELTLRDADSVAPGIRLLVRPEFGMKDYMLMGREVLQIYQLTKGPDDDYPFRSFRGQRLGMFGTTPEFHTNGSMAYKVEVHPPGSVFSPNGMPLTHLFFKNDDGGPLYGRDSYLEFTPPADGDYLVRVTDVRGQQGDKFAYKLRVHAPRPDFNILFNPAAIAIPKDGTMVASLECERREGFDGEIAVRLEGLPTGFTATPAVIEAGETAASLSISVAPGTENPKMDSPATYRVVATALIGGKEVSHVIEPDNKGRRVSIGAESKVQVTTDVREATLRPGGETVVEARITRRNGFKGRVPLDVRNLPYGVKVDDVGLNGVLITENDTSRKFVIRCEPWVKPQSRLFYVTANVEGGVANTALPLTLHVGATHHEPRATSLPN